VAVSAGRTLDQTHLQRKSNLRSRHEFDAADAKLPSGMRIEHFAEVWPVPGWGGLAFEAQGKPGDMILLLIVLAALVVLGVVLAVAVVKWLFILAVVAALVWVILFFVRGIERRA
jgi:hypothetical protein